MRLLARAYTKLLFVITCVSLIVLPLTPVAATAPRHIPAVTTDQQSSYPPPRVARTAPVTEENALFQQNQNMKCPATNVELETGSKSGFTFNTFTGFIQNHLCTNYGVEGGSNRPDPDQPAPIIAEGALGLVKGSSSRSSAWYSTKQFIAGGFETTFEFKISKPLHSNPAADGLAFVIQNHAVNALATSGGGGMGFGGDNTLGGGIPKSLAVAFDVFCNPEHSDNHPYSNCNPPNGRLHISIHTKHQNPNTIIHQTSNPNDYNFPHTTQPLIGNVTQKVKIVYNATNQILYIFLSQNNNVVWSLEKKDVDFSDIVDEQGRAWVGFTAAAGWTYYNHDILSWEFKPGAPIDPDNIAGAGDCSSCVDSLAAQQAHVMVAGPINPQTGNYTYSQSDLSVRGRRLPLTFRRDYSQYRTRWSDEMLGQG